MLVKNANGFWVSQCLLLMIDFWSTVSHTTASTSSGSSDTGMSPSSASPTQNTVAVECRWCHARRAPSRPAPPLPSQPPAASTETRILTSQSKQPIALDCPPPPRLLWSLSATPTFCTLWTDPASSRSLSAPGNGLYVRVECNLRNQSLRFIHPEWIRRHFSLLYKRWTETSSYCFCAAATANQSVVRSSIRTW